MKSGKDELLALAKGLRQAGGGIFQIAAGLFDKQVKFDNNNPDAMACYDAAGAAGIGLGGAMYRRGDDPTRDSANPRDFVAAWKRLRSVAG